MQSPWSIGNIDQDSDHGARLSAGMGGPLKTGTPFPLLFDAFRNPGEVPTLGYWMVLDGIGWYWMVLDGIGWYWMDWMVLDGIGWYWMVLV